MVYLTPTLNILTKLIRTIGKKLIRDFNEIEKLQSSVKGTETFAKNTKERLTKELFQSLQEVKPYDCVFIDKIKTNIISDSGWIVNPLNGITNFCHGIPHFCISIAMIEKKEITCSVIYDPIKDEIFYASKGKGAYLNDSRIRVSNRGSQNELIISIDTKHLKNKKIPGNILIDEFNIIRKTGCYDLDLCYVASGRNEAFYKNIAEQNELSAGLLIAREAGGLIEKIQIDNQNSYLVSNPTCIEYVKKFLNKNVKN